MKKPLTEMSPQEWLQYQRKIHGYTDEKIPIQAVKKILKEILGEIPKEGQVILSKYSSLTRADADNRQIELLQTPIKRILKSEEKDRVDKAFVGVFPTYDVNGFAGTTPKGDRIAMLHNGIFLAISAMADLELRDQENTLSNYPLTHEETLSHLAFVANLWLGGRGVVFPDSSLIKPSSKQSLLCSSALKHSAMIFILGHEYGHIIENHYKYDYRNASINHEMEFVADSWAFRLCTRNILLNGPLYGGTSQSKYMFLGPFVALGTISMFSSEPSSTHPPACHRMEKVKLSLLPIVKEELGEKGYTLYQKSMGKDFCKRLCKMGEKIFSKMQVYRRIVVRLLSKERRPRRPDFLTGSPTS